MVVACGDVRHGNPGACADAARSGGNGCPDIAARRNRSASAGNDRRAPGNGKAVGAHSRPYGQAGAPPRCLPLPAQPAPRGLSTPASERSTPLPRIPACPAPFRPSSVGSGIGETPVSQDVNDVFQAETVHRMGSRRGRADLDVQNPRGASPSTRDTARWTADDVVLVFRAIRLAGLPERPRASRAAAVAGP